MTQADWQSFDDELELIRKEEAVDAAEFQHAIGQQPRLAGHRALQALLVAEVDREGRRTLGEFATVLGLSRALVHTLMTELRLDGTVTKFGSGRYTLASSVVPFRRAV